MSSRLCRNAALATEILDEETVIGDAAGIYTAAMAITPTQSTILTETYLIKISAVILPQTYFPSRLFNLLLFLSFFYAP